MKSFKSLFTLRLTLQLQYRVAAVAGVFTQIFFGLVMVMVYEAFFRTRSIGLPMTYQETVTYIWLGQGFLALLPWNGDKEVQGMIRSGDVAYELIRPIGLYEYWYFRMLAQRIGQTILRALPLFLVVVFLMPEAYKMGRPYSGLHLICFVVAMFFGILLGGTITNLLTITTMFTIGDGMDRFFPAVVMLCSGLVIPLAYFPDHLVAAIRLLPFGGVSDGPYRIYLGFVSPTQALFIIAHQLVWTLLLFLLGKWLLGLASKKLVVQGG